MVLQPCPRCRRHVAVDAVACPFCAAPRRAPAAVATIAYGTFSRAAVFAGAVGGCVVNPPPQYQQQPPPPPAEPPPGEPPPQQQFAQPPVGNGTIRGVVRLVSGSPANNVAVYLERSGRASQSTVTSPSGEYVFAGVPAGDYVISFGARDPRRPPVQRTIKLADGATQRIDIAIDVEVPVEAPVYDRSHEARPYGAPPARRRVV